MPQSHQLKTVKRCKDSATAEVKMLLGVAMDFYVIAFSRGVAPVTTLDIDYYSGAFQTAPRLLTPRPRAKASRRAIGKTGFYIDRVLPAKFKERDNRLHRLRDPCERNKTKKRRRRKETSS